VVYFSGKKVGWNLLDERDSKELFSAFSRTYIKMKDLAIKGEKFVLPSEESKESDLKPLDQKLLEKLRKKHNI
jgi:hypothetical protein